MVEVHPDPSQALSDAAQTIDPQTFAETMDACRRIARTLGLRMDEPLRVAP